jgi:cell division protein FtsN
MSRDYKPTPKTAQKKTASPMLAGIMIGIFIGLAIAVAVAVYIKAGPSPFVERKQQDGLPVTPVTPSKGESTVEPPTPKPTEKPRFDFYTILPGAEEPAKVKEKIVPQQESAETTKNQYYLQVGAFQKEADADNLKAKLALMGMEANIQTATIPDKGIWHRVRVGPYANIEELNRVRSSLSQNGMSASLVKATEPTNH